MLPCQRTPLLKPVMVGGILIIGLFLSGCGKKNFPEAPLRPNEKIEKGQERKKEDSRRPITKPDKSFILDPLL